MKHRPLRLSTSLVKGMQLVVYSSSARRPRRRLGVAFFLHSGHGEMMLSVLAAGGVAPLGTIHNSTLRSERQPPSIVTILPASIPRVFTM